MTRLNNSKINQLMRNWPAGTVGTSTWLEQNGVYRQLAMIYEKSSWIERIGSGAFIRVGDKVDWTGGVYAIQKQLSLPFHVGGKTALALFGGIRYLPFGKGYRAYLYSDLRSVPPKWFTQAKWDVKPRHVMTGFLGFHNKQGLVEREMGNYSITVSAPERAILELLHLVPQQETFQESFEIMETLTGLRMKILQPLLERCSSMKVKRLFLFMAERANHSWVKELGLSKIKTGKGKRSLCPGGHFDRKYQITVPKNFANTDEKDMP